MLKKSARFTRDSFPKKRASKRHHTSWGAVSLYPLPYLRASVVVSKKVLRKAHDRNRLKRRIYNALKVATGGDTQQGIIVFPRKEALTLPFKTLTDDLIAALAEKR